MAPFLLFNFNNQCLFRRIQRLPLLLNSMDDCVSLILEKGDLHNMIQIRMMKKVTVATFLQIIECFIVESFKCLIECKYPQHVLLHVTCTLKQPKSFSINEKRHGKFFLRVNSTVITIRKFTVSQPYFLAREVYTFTRID